MTQAARHNLRARRSLPASTGAIARSAGAASTSHAGDPFYGAHQAGIATRQQAHTCFATFDLSADTRIELRTLLQRWTREAARLCAGTPAAPRLPAAHLTITFGFGAGLFLKDGRDRYGLAGQRPEALVDLPGFAGDHEWPERCGGDLSVQACADDPHSAFHALRQMLRLAHGTAQLRWGQSGFVPSLVGRTPCEPRDAIGEADLRSAVWVGDEGPPWMYGGTYVVPRRIRFTLEPWARLEAGFPPPRIGRSACADTETGAPMLRRGYSYRDSVHLDGESESGLLFVAYQKDPRTGLIKMLDRIAKFDMTRQFVTHTGGGVFACPPGCVAGECIGAKLFA